MKFVSKQKAVRLHGEKLVDLDILQDQESELNLERSWECPNLHLFNIVCWSEA